MSDYDPLACTPMPTRCTKWDCDGEVRPRGGFVVCSDCGVSYGPSRKESTTQREREAVVLLRAARTLHPRDHLHPEWLQRVNAWLDAASDEGAA